MSNTGSRSAPRAPEGWVEAIVGLGSNLGDREGHLRAGLTALIQGGATRLLAVSSWRETEPVGGPPQGPFLNGAARLATRLSPEALLTACREAEAGERRERNIYWGPRTLDLDILLYGDRVIVTPALTVPHPRLLDRAFALEPAAEVAPGWTHPLTGRTLAAHWRELCAGGVR